MKLVDAEFIVKAVNSYDKNQETIRGLVETLESAKESLRILYPTINGTKIGVEIDETLAKAREVL